MSFPARCPSCTANNHEYHQVRPSTQPEGLIGGTVCECRGECEDDLQTIHAIDRLELEILYGRRERP